MIKSNRAGFSMMMAILVIVMMSTLSVFVMNLSAKMLQNTTAQYQREQAMLLAKSYTEFAIMSIMSNDRANTYSGGNTCIDTITGDTGNSANGQGYRINVRIAYIGGAIVAGCTNVISSTVATTASSLNAIIDVSIDYKDINNPNIANSQWIRYHRRTLQKI